MRSLIILAAAISVSAFAANKKTMEKIPELGKTTKDCKHSPDTAKRELSAIYSAEKAYFSEKSEFSEEFADIGYDPNLNVDDEGGCDISNWDFTIQRVERPGHFTASAHSLVTGEEMIINEKKEITADRL
jgi:hypothetical protein